MDSDIVKQIRDTLEKLRPFIQRDGGDVEFESFDESTGTVYIRMLGACAGCMFIDSTLTYGIEAILIEEVPGVVACKVAETNTQSDKKE